MGESARVTQADTDRHRQTQTPGQPAALMECADAWVGGGIHARETDWAAALMQKIAIKQPEGIKLEDSMHMR